MQNGEPVSLTHGEIRLTERAHYYMQLSAYFTELVDMAGMRFAFTDRLADTWYNQAYDLDWDSGDVQGLGRLLTTTCESRHRAPCIYLSPASQPGDAELMLRKIGLVDFETEAWMFLMPGTAIRSTEPVIEIEDVSMGHNFDAFAEVYREGLPGDDVESYIESVRLGLRYAPPGVDVRYLLARIEHKPVGMLSILSTERCSGIYAVATLHKFQRRGIARALCARASAIAKSNGSEYLFLQTVIGDEGEQAFGRIGFETRYTRTGYTTEEVARSIIHG